MLPTDPVGDLIGAPVATIPPTATLRQVAEALVTDDVGLLVVVDPGGVRGVISERDIVTAVADGLDLDEERALDAASTDVVSVETDTSVLEAARTMAGAGIRHLAVAERGVTTGVLSIRDVLGILLDHEIPIRVP